MEGQHHGGFYHPQQQQQYSHLVSVDRGGGDRVPQWSNQETRDLLLFRAELDQAFMETKRNKALWEVMSNKMKEKGYHRTPEQCKCKWKNLVTRYKGSETGMEVETTRQQFPFYEEVQTIFVGRMQRMLWLELEGTASDSVKKRSGRLSSDEEDDNEDSEVEKSATKKRKKRAKATNTSGSGSSATNINNLQEILEEFMKQQMKLEMQWREWREEREEERRVREMEWRERMEALEKERLSIERSWREREEQRMAREEERAARRDVLVTALLNKLKNQDM